MKEGKRVLVIDEYKSNAASRIASGVINPVTGRRVVKTWKIDELMPFAWNAYNEIGEMLSLKNVIRECGVLDIHATMQMQQAFETRLQDEQHDYVSQCADEDEWKKYFQFSFGIGQIYPSYCINLIDLLQTWRSYLSGANCLLDERFEQEQLQLNETSVVYKNFFAQKIVFCDGINSRENKYFAHLPFAFNKGEALIVSIADLPRNFIYKQGFSLVPWKEEDLFWIGSTYEWNFENDLPTEDFRVKVETYLREHLKVPYSVKNHFAALRPANTQRRPFVGLHLLYPQVGILNGMGTKGCSLAPYYASQFIQHLINGGAIDDEANVSRFALP